MKREIMIALKNIVLTIIIVIIFASCDKIEPPYKQSGNTQIETPTRKVLLEDYTGHTCVNCPAAAKKALEIQQLYGDKMIIMTVHAGFFALPTASPFNNDYRTPAGEEWDQFFGLSAAGNPIGMINRQNTGGVYGLGNGNWGTGVAAIIEDASIIKLEIETSFNETNRKLDVELKSTFLEAASGNYKIVACIVEDSLVSAQRNNDQTIGPATILDYVHRHVLRENINGSWGEDLIAVGQLPSSTSNKQYSVTLNAIYKANHTSVVAFVYDALTFEILQVEEKHIY